MNGTTSGTKGFLSPASFWIPDYLPASAWIEQAPIAFWLTETLRPGCFVDLGPGEGCSYFAFCQAIETLRLRTRAYAVGAWTGEDAAYHAVAVINRRYAAFSTPIRDPFDAARTRFASGSIDLLHLDGVGTCEALRATLDGWQDRLTADAVVLLHGAGAQEGAQRLFTELRARHPAFLFPHGQGLGIVAPGGSVPAPLRALLAQTGEGAHQIAATYAALGVALRARRHVIAGASDGGDVRTVMAADGARAPGDLDRKADGLRAGGRDGLRQFEARLAALESRLRDAGPPPQTGGDVGPQPMTAPGPATADLDRLQAKLRDARSGEASAQRFAQAARRAIQAHRGDLERQALDLEKAAASARADVVKLSADAWTLLESEHAAHQNRQQAQHRLDDLLRHEQTMLMPRPGLRDVLSLGGARRWRRQAKTYATLVARVDEASAAIQEAQRRYEAAKEAHRQAEQVAVAAEPRASELASAAVVVRGEVVAAEEILSMLPAGPGDDAAPQTNDYGRWVDLYDTITPSDRRGIKARMLRLTHRPLISIVVPVYNTPLPFLRQAVASVQAQLYPHWELCLADDASPDPAVFEALQGFADADPRIKIVRRDSNGHISAASNSALALATGEFVALMDHDDILAEQALFEVAVCLNEDRDLDLIYSDEDHIDQHGTRNNPYFKSEFNLELMLGQNMISHLGVYRRALLEKIGGFRLGFEGSQDYDLALRFIDATSPERIRHIPDVLYHWRSNSGDATFSESAMERCIQTARRALADHLVRRGQAGDVVAHPLVPLWQRIKRARPDPAPLVSVIVPTKDKAEILGPCVEGILNRTDYPNLELIIVDHQSTEPSALHLLAELAKDPRVEIMPYAGAFNYSAINNAAVARARGTVLALLNNDVDVIDPDWLDEMVSLAVLPEIGAVGAKLLYPDNLVQHAGVLLGTGGVAGHLYHLLHAHHTGYFGRAVMTSAVSAVTAACLVVRRSVFDEVGGFDEVNLPVAFNDVDLCLKIGQSGYRNVFAAQASLYHHESLSRGSDQVGERLERFNREVEFMMQKWDGVLDADPFYNPNLNVSAADFSLAFPPRRRKPWRATEAGG